MLRAAPILVLIANVFCTTGDITERRGRVFGYGNPYTVTLTEERFATVWEPSSCIYMPPSLKPCLKIRNIRNFPIFGIQQPTPIASMPQESLVTKEATPVQNRNSNGTDVHVTPLNWVEYLGLRAATMTVVSTRIVPTTIIDPNVFVKFTVRGCRPFDLPPDMETCSVEPTPTLEIQPTSVDRYPKSFAHTAIKEFPSWSSPSLDNINSIEGTEEDTFSSTSNAPTQILDDI